MAGGDEIHYLPKPTAKRALAQLRQQSAHGDRVRDIADARRLRARLDEESPHGTGDADEGFSVEAIHYERLCREYIQISMDHATNKAWQYRRCIRRAHLQNGGGR